MQLDLTSEDDVLLVTTNGRITCEHAAGHVDPLAEKAGQHVYMCKILLDLSNSEYVDSSGISWLLSLHKRTREAKGMLVLHSVPPLVLQTLKILQLDRVLHLAKSLPAARALASQGPPAASEKPVVGEPA